MPKRIEGRNGWCGPSAIATITGVTTDRAADIIGGGRSVRGTYFHELRNCLRELGWRTHQRAVIYPLGEDGLRRAPTLARWLKDRESMRDIYLVEVTGHWVVARGRKIADSRHREPVFLRSFKGRRCRVRRVWRVWRSGNGV